MSNSDPFKQGLISDLRPLAAEAKLLFGRRGKLSPEQEVELVFLREANARFEKAWREEADARTRFQLLLEAHRQSEAERIARLPWNRALRWFRSIL